MAIDLASVARQLISMAETDGLTPTQLHPYGSYGSSPPPRPPSSRRRRYFEAASLVLRAQALLEENQAEITAEQAAERERMRITEVQGEKP